MAWSVVITVVWSILAVTALHQVEHVIDGTRPAILKPSASLSAPCRAAIDAGEDPLSIAVCAHDSQTAILEYQFLNGQQ